MAPRIDLGIDSSYSDLAVRSGLFAARGSIEVERDRFLEDLLSYKLENYQSKMIIVEKDAAIRTMCIFLPDMEKKQLKLKQRRALWKNVTQNYLHLQDGNELGVSAMRDSFILIISSIYLGFALHIEMNIVQCCRKKVFEVVCLQLSYKEAGRCVVTTNKN